MREDRKKYAVIAVMLLLASAGLFWWSGTTASAAINDTFKPYNAALKKAHLAPMNIFPYAFWEYKAYDKRYPDLILRPTGQPCGSNCLAQFAVNTHPLFKTRFGGVPVGWGGSAGLVCLILGAVSIGQVTKPNPRRNLVNLGRDRIRLRTEGDVLPIVQAGRTRWGLMRRDNLKKGGRREMGNAMFVGKPGRGKSSLLKLWLLTADALNYVVIDLKGELWATTAAHRADLGRVIRLDLTSMEGHALDPLDTDDRGTAQAVIDAFLPSETGSKSDYFNKLASEIALAYWSAAKQTGQSALTVLVRAATSPTKDMLELAKGLVALAPPQARSELLRSFEAAFGLLWNDPDAIGERNSVVQSFKAGFAALDTPEILSTLCRTTFDPAELVEGRATIYITAPSTSAPYGGPLGALMGAIIQVITRYVDQELEGKQGEDIVILADEAGTLHIPSFAETLAHGRSRGITVTAFVQSMGQLDQYHKRGWRGIVDTLHHWIWWSSNDPDAHAFLRHRCGVYDAPNASRRPEERERQPYTDAYAFDEISPKWGELDVIALLDYDRTYPVFGPAVTPYQNGALKREMERPAPELPRLGRIPAVRVAQPPSAASALPSSLRAAPQAQSERLVKPKEFRSPTPPEEESETF